MGDIALVTGASSGIGDAIARGLARRGHDLVVVARAADRLDALARELHNAFNIQVETMAADLTDENERAVVEKRLQAEAAPISILVNNAGYGSSGPFSDLPIDREMGQVELNIVALARLTHAAIPGMVARGRGGIMNVSSVASFQPGPGSATYAATKAYVTSFSEALHEELRDTGVKVSCLCPGYTRTEFHQRADIHREAVPDILWLTADDVAEAGIRGLERNQAIVVPGLQYKVVATAGRVLPRGAVRRIASLVTGRTAKQRLSRPG